MRTLTLDTSCVIHGAQGQSQAGLVNRLRAAHRAGRVRLALTTAYARDQEGNTPDRIAVNEAWLASLDVVATPGGPLRLNYSRLDGFDVLADAVPGPARWDYSTWDGPDVWTDGDDTVDEAVRRIVLPPRLWPESMTEHSVLSAKDVERMHDVQHLMAHRMAGHDAFVTTDEDDILDKADQLRTEVGIVVWSLEQAVAEVER
jgi:hypothetical protein